MLLVAVLAAALALVVAVSHVYLRDTRYIVQASLLGWLWLTPVVYPMTQLHGWLRDVVDINPMTGVVACFHAAVYSARFEPGLILVTLAWSTGLIALAVYLHARFDRVLADLL